MEFRRNEHANGFEVVLLMVVRCDIEETSEDQEFFRTVVLGLGIVVAQLKDLPYIAPCKHSAPPSYRVPLTVFQPRNVSLATCAL